MGEKDKQGTGHGTEKSRIRIAQVVAAGLAATTAAFLGSSLGVYGTVLGAGLISVLTTVGSELYLRSLESTARLDWRGRAARLRPRRPGSPAQASAQAMPDSQPAQLLAIGGGHRVHQRKSRRGLRWGLIAASSAIAFGIGMVVLTGFELGTGGAITGGGSSTIGAIVNPGAQIKPQGNEPAHHPGGSTHSGGSREHPEPPPAHQPQTKPAPATSTEKPTKPPATTTTSAAPTTIPKKDMRTVPPTD